MVDATLSQDEINDLLAGVSNDAGEAAENIIKDSNDKATDFEKMAKTMASAQAISLSSISTRKTNISVVSCRSCKLAEASVGFEGEALVVKINYTSPANGTGFYLLKKSDALRLANLMIGSKAISLDDMSLSALEEAFKQIVSSVNAAISPKVANSGIQLTVESIPNNLTIPEDKYIVIKNAVNIGDNIRFEYLQLYSPLLAKTMNNLKSKENLIDGNDAFNLGEKENMDVENLIGGSSASNIDIHGVEFGNLADSKNSTAPGSNIDLLLDVSMEVTVELGRSTKTVQEILSLGEGSIIELDKLAGEAVDLLVNNKPIAKGEVVVIDENFGVRVTEIVSPKHRISTAKD